MGIHQNKPVLRSLIIEMKLTLVILAAMVLCAAANVIPSARASSKQSVAVPVDHLSPNSQSSKVSSSSSSESDESGQITDMTKIEASAKPYGQSLYNYCFIFCWP